MSPGKHGPNRLPNYLAVHHTVMDRLLREGFVLSEDLYFEAGGAGGFLLTGRIDCLGGVYIDVRKHIICVGGVGAERLVQTSEYSYNIVLKGRGNILRYDSPHSDHHPEHHVHR